MLASGCFSKPDFTGMRDGGPDDARDDAEIDGPPVGPCAWMDFADQLRVYLPLDEGTGTNADDRSPDDLDGTLTGATFTGAGRIGGAASFAELTDARIDLGSSSLLDNMTAVSACAWVFLDTLPVDLASTIVDKSSNGFVGGWNMYFEKAPARRVGFLTSFGDYVSGSKDYTTGQWMHLCATWDGTVGPQGIKLYRDGEVDAQDRIVAGDGMRDDDGPEPLVLGRASNSNVYNLNGKIDEFFLFERVLSLGEVASLHACAP